MIMGGLLFAGLVFNIANYDFFAMVHDKVKYEGCWWHYTGRTVVTDEFAIPITEFDGTKVYYWHICKK